ncbi:MAG: MTH1187 family thiamine-binding protein [Thaumarchaeota archaeon]|nr:MTH1187 family thiamine-binding protein [Nitrososphaerota archaeon]
MIHAEVSVYPMGTNTTSASFYIAKGIEAIQSLDGVRFEVNAMGTVLESENVDKIFEASKRIMEAIHNSGVQRVEVVLKIDSRKDKDSKLEDKLESLQKYLKSK